MIENFFLDAVMHLKSGQHIQIWTSSILVAIIVVCIVLRFKKRYKLPPGPSGLPVVGYLPFIGPEPFKDFHRMSRKYGNVFGFYLGRTYNVVLGDYETVKEAFSFPGTAGRPPKFYTTLPDEIGFIGMSGQEWWEQRRHCVRAWTQVGLGTSRWEFLIQEEVEDFIKELSECNGQPVDGCSFMSSGICHILSRLLFGHRLTENEETVKFSTENVAAVMEYFTLTGWRTHFPLICDVIAKLGFSKYAEIYKRMMEFHKFVRCEVERQKAKANKSEPSNFVDGYLLEMQNNKEKRLGNAFNDTNLNGNVQAFYLAAVDTTKVSMNWLLLIMAEYPDIQEKVHAELDAVLGKDGKINFSQKSSLPYTVAVILEGQRWRTITPLNPPRYAVEDVKIGGYDIPKGTTIIANTWALHNDTQYWDDPHAFKPERFLSDDGKQVNAKKESYIPFSYGKRNCPGETVAMMLILLYFVAILQKFRILPPEGERINMQGLAGMTYESAPQPLRFVRRE